MIGASLADHNAGAPLATAALATMLSNMRRREILIATILPDSNHTLHAVIMHPGRQNTGQLANFRPPSSFIAAFGRLRKVFARTVAKLSTQDEVIANRSDNWRQYLPGGTFWQKLTAATVAEFATLVGFTTFFLGYGLIPYLGGSVIGLVGADEPRYAQIAREMLARHDFITPVLYGKPWLEKPALYYWRAMFSFKDSAFTTGRLACLRRNRLILLILIYLHMRRFRPGGQLDAALITVSCVAIIGFARGASTDMQLAAPFCIGMLGWYAWYETGQEVLAVRSLFFRRRPQRSPKVRSRHSWHSASFFCFAALRQRMVAAAADHLDSRNRLISGDGFAVVHCGAASKPAVPSCVFLEHNLERFATDRFRHSQAIWFYIPIMALALLPWLALAWAACWDAVRDSIDEWKVRRNPDRYIGNPRAGDAFPEFLVLWAAFPIVFFSFSQSKLPGYILPAVPPITILCGDYLNRIRKRGLKMPLVTIHAIVVGALVAATLMLPMILIHPHQWPPLRVILAAIMEGTAVAIAILVVVVRFGMNRLRVATLIPVALILCSCWEHAMARCSIKNILRVLWPMKSPRCRMPLTSLPCTRLAATSSMVWAFI